MHVCPNAMPPACLRVFAAMLTATGLSLIAAGCATAQSSGAVAAPVPVTDKGVMAFRDICLATAPSFDKAWVAAQKYGVKPDTDLGMNLGTGRMGMAADNSLSVQIKPHKECGTTTEPRPGNAVIAQFWTVVAKATGMPIADLSPPARGTFKGAGFLLRYDRKGGEAYVMQSIGE